MSQPENPFAFDTSRKQRKPQDYYDEIKKKFGAERDLRLGYRPEGTPQFTSEFAGGLEKYAIDPNVSGERDDTPRLPRGRQGGEGSSNG